MGWSVRVFHILVGLSRVHETHAFLLSAIETPIPFHPGWETLVVPSRTDVSPLKPKHAGIIARWANTNSQKLSWLDSMVRRTQPDCILGFGHESIGYVALLDSLGRPKILDIIDDEVLQGWRDIKAGGLCLKNIKVLISDFLIQRQFLKKCNAIITVSERDSSSVRRRCGLPHVYTVPNGVDTTYYENSTKTSPEPKSVLFCGSLSFPPNIVGITWFLQECWPLVRKRHSTASLTVIGKNPGNDLLSYNQREGVHIIGFVPDTRPYLSRAQVVIVPMLSGSGIKNKILEAWAMAKPVVSTTLGIEGVKGRDGEDLLVADTPSAFADQVDRLFTDGQLQDRLGVRGRERVLKEYAWQNSVNRFEALIQSTVF